MNHIDFYNNISRFLDAYTKLSFHSVNSISYMSLSKDERTYLINKLKYDNDIVKYNKQRINQLFNISNSIQYGMCKRCCRRGYLLYDKCFENVRIYCSVCEEPLKCSKHTNDTCSFKCWKKNIAKKYLNE